MRPALGSAAAGAKVAAAAKRGKELRARSMAIFIGSGGKRRGRPGEGSNGRPLMAFGVKTASVTGRRREGGAGGACVRGGDAARAGGAAQEVGRRRAWRRRRAAAVSVRSGWRLGKALTGGPRLSVGGEGAWASWANWAGGKGWPAGEKGREERGGPVALCADDAGCAGPTRSRPGSWVRARPKRKERLFQKLFHVGIYNQNILDK